MKNALLIVAHPDDELLWFGGLLLTQKHLDWTIISVTYSDKTGRGLEFLEVCKKLDAKGVLLDFEDKENVLLDEDKLLKVLIDFSNKNTFDIVFTHNQNGEYGHPHHRQISRIVQTVYDNVVTSGYGANALNCYLNLSPEIVKQKQELSRIYCTGGKSDRIKAYPAYDANKEPYRSSGLINLPSFKKCTEVCCQQFSGKEKLALKSVDKAIKILILADAPGWAHQAIIDKLVFSIGAYFKIDVLYFYNIDFTERTNVSFNHHDYDLIHLFSPRYLSLISEKQIPANKLVTTVHSHRVMETEKQFIANKEYFKSVSVVSQKLLNELKKRRNDACLTPCGVDTQQFYPNYANRNKALSVCTVARKYNTENEDDIKGLNKIIMPLSERFNLTILEDSRYLYKDMHKFYNQFNVYVCASLNEGNPLPVLEAASCGLAVVSTNVGIVPEIVSDKSIVSRELSSFMNWLNWAKNNPEEIKKIGKENRKIILAKRDWAVVIEYWRDFYLNALN